MRRWRQVGVPPKVRSDAERRLGGYGQVVREARQSAQDDYQTFLQLLKASGELAEFPRMVTTQGHISGRTARRYQWSKAWSRQLGDALLRAIEVWLASLERQRRYEWWQAMAVVSLFGAAEHEARTPAGGRYSSVYIYLDLPRAGDWCLKAEVPTKKHRRLGEVQAHLRALLEGIIADGLYAFVHGTFCWNWRLRTPEERRAEDTRARRERAQRRERGLPTRAQERKAAWRKRIAKQRRPQPVRRKKQRSKRGKKFVKKLSRKRSKRS